MQTIARKVEEQLISFETAKLAKEKGFDWKVANYFSSTGNSGECGINSEFFDTEFRQPRQSLLQKWLRDVYNIEINISQNINVHVEYYYFPSVVTLAPNKLSLIETEIEGLFYSYEEALEIALKQALNLL